MRHAAPRNQGKVRSLTCRNSCSWPDRIARRTWKLGKRWRDELLISISRNLMQHILQEIWTNSQGLFDWKPGQWQQTLQGFLQTYAGKIWETSTAQLDVYMVQRRPPPPPPPVDGSWSPPPPPVVVGLWWGSACFWCCWLSLVSSASPPPCGCVDGSWWWWRCWKYVYKYLCVYEYIYMYMYMMKWICTYNHMYIYVYIYTYVIMFMNMYVYGYVSSPPLWCG